MTVISLSFLVYVSFLKFLQRILAYETLADEQKRRDYDAGGWSFDQQQQHAQDFDFNAFMRDFQESMITFHKNLVVFKVQKSFERGL